MTRSAELRALAQRVTDALPAEIAEEVVLTGSVSRGVADTVSDIEMLVVTRQRLELAECFELARGAGFERLDSWGVQGTEVSRVFGYCESVPIELTWWPREFAESSVSALFDVGHSSLAEALVSGVSLRTVGLLERWQNDLRVYPETLAATRIEDAALTWGGFHPTGFLTLARPGDRLALIERLYDDARRVLRIVYALNLVWPPTNKRLAARLDTLAVKPEQLADRIEEALTEPDPLRAMLVMSELQEDTVALAPSGPNVVRARQWLHEVTEVLRTAASRP